MQKQSTTNQHRCPQQTFLSTLSYTRTSKQHFTKLKSCSAFSVGRTPSSQHALLNHPAFTDLLASSSPFHCLCALVHAFGHAYVCEHVRTQCTLTGQKITSGVSAQALHILFETGSLWPGSLLHSQASWPANLQGSSCVPPSCCTRVTGIYHLYLGSRGLNSGPPHTCKARTAPTEPSPQWLSIATWYMPSRGTLAHCAPTVCARVS